MIEKIISAWVCILEKKILKNVWLWKPFSTTFNHENDSTRGLPYQYTIHQALQIMRIHVDGLMKNWPPHSAPVFYSSWENEHIFVQPPICMQINVKNPNGMKYWRIYPGGEVGRNLSPRLRPCLITLSCAFLMLSGSWSRMVKFQPRLLSLGNSSLLKISLRAWHKWSSV